MDGAFSYHHRLNGQKGIIVGLGCRFMSLAKSAAAEDLSDRRSPVLDVIAADPLLHLCRVHLETSNPLLLISNPLTYPLVMLGQGEVCYEAKGATRHSSNRHVALVSPSLACYPAFHH